ncbi:MAG TPA: type I restriction-modification enzyme R subunit C-terminal domain-containing protein [Candidatus Binatia bacterium]|jgi:type I restriction enzyme R subunit
MTSPEDQARENIDRMLVGAGWEVRNVSDANISASQGLAIRNFPLKTGHGFADYLLYVNGSAAGVIEAKKEGVTLTGVETQSDKYTKGLPDGLPALKKPLPFSYESTGVETRFTNGLDPDPRSRPVFSFHKPDTLAKWFEIGDGVVAEKPEDYGNRKGTFLARMQHMPPLIDDLWPPKPQAIANIERSLRENRPRALVQMATGSGKTLLAIVLAYRLLKFAGARRVLFLVDRGNLSRQAYKEFQQYTSPYNNYKFTEEYVVQRLTSNTLYTTARVCIGTIQRLYSMLRGEEIADDLEEQSVEGLQNVFKQPLPIEYNPKIPIETFDVIITDECHRSIYHLWRQVLEYFDGYIIGLTATPNKQTFGFFNQNLVMEYGHEQAVADNVNVNYDVYRIKTEITEGGAKVDAGYYVDKRDRKTREVRWEMLDDDLQYGAEELDRDVVAKDQIRTVIRTFRDKLFTEIFPGRRDVPKTLIYAKDDSHADDIVQIVREEFGKGNEFAQKITYRTGFIAVTEIFVGPDGKESEKVVWKKVSNLSPEEILQSFRNSYFPRIAVTVDMIATGTDIKPLEVVLFMRSVKSRSFFEQMKGRGVRVIDDNDLKAVTPDAGTKDHYVIVDAVGVCERDKTDSRPMDQRKSIPFDKLLQAIGLGNKDPEVVSSVAARLARLNKTLEEDEKAEVQKRADGQSLTSITTTLVNSLDADKHVERAKKDFKTETPNEEQIQNAADKLIQEAVKPLHNPELRKVLIELKQQHEQTIDHLSQDKVIEAGFSADALERAKGIVQSFEQFIKDHKDEITALQILYSRPYKQRLRFEDIKELANTIEKPPRLWTESQLWQAYAALDKSKVKGANTKRILTDLVSLVRFAIHQDNELIPFPERVNANFKSWLAQQESSGKKFTPDQRRWLEMIRDHIAANLGIDPKDFDYAPFAQEGGLGKVHQLFGSELNKIIDELNGMLAA